jgi:YD repeat-containing protein
MVWFWQLANLTSDGVRDYARDAENRFTAIAYPGQPGKETVFAYDGLGRRGAIHPLGQPSTPASHTSLATSVIGPMVARGLLGR